MGYECWFDGGAAKGAVGETGNIPSLNNFGKAGENGQFINVVGKPDVNSFSHTFFTMVLADAEKDYLNGEREEAGQKLLWLSEILTTGTQFSAEAADMSDENSDGGQACAIMLEQVMILLTQLSIGLDYYGHPPNHVPLTSLKVYNQVIDQMLVLATDIEDAHRKYYQQGQDDVAKRNAISQAVSSLSRQATVFEMQFGQLQIEVDKNRGQISDLLEEQIALEVQLEIARESFINAVEAQAACGFADVLKAVGAVAAIASGVGTTAGGLLAMGEAGSLIKQSESLKDWKKTGKFIAKEWREVGSGIGSLKKGYNDIKELLEQGDRDAAKLITAQEDFEEQMKPFLDLEEAQEYIALMRTFTQITNLRNKKILETDAKIAMLYEVEAESASLRLDVDRTNSRLIDVFNPRLAEHIVFFEKAVNRAKYGLLRSMVMAHRAMSYWSLNTNKPPFDLQSRSVDYLKTYHFEFKQQFLNILELRNSEPLPFSTGSIRFDRNNQPEAWRAFDETGRFSFTLDPEHPVFLFTSRVLVNGASLKLLLDTPQNSYSWVFLRHHGDAKLIDTMGNEHSFSHRSREIRKVLNANTEQISINLGGSEKYAFLSPLATWTLIMEFADSEGRPKTGTEEKNARQNVNGLEIAFDGVADSRYGNERLMNGQ
jgi:hypothetical protein